MGRITSGTNRGYDKLAGRNAGSLSARILKPFLLVAVVVGLLNWLGGEAQAATARADQSPRFACNTAIRWDYNDTYEPSGVNTFDLVDWAYNQVDEVANIETKQIASADVKWEWQSADSGGSFRPGETYRSSAAFGEKSWVHGLNSDRVWTQDALREHVLRAVLTDLGVESPTSTGAGTTAEDRGDLARACKRSADKSDEADNDGGGLLSGIKPDGVGLQGRTIFGGLNTIDLLVLLLAIGPLGVFLCAGERLTGRFGRKPTDADADFDGVADPA